MKSIIPVLAVMALATLALTGCGPGSSSDTTNPAATNSSPAYTNSMSGASPTPPPTNSMPYGNTNMPASTNQ
jgi:hypothetical protein